MVWLLWLSAQTPRRRDLRGGIKRRSGLLTRYLFPPSRSKQARGLARAQPKSDGSAPRQHQARQVPDQPAGELGTGESGDPGRAATKVEKSCSRQRDLLSTAVQDEIEYLTTNAEMEPESSVRMPFLTLARRRRPLFLYPRVTR